MSDSKKPIRIWICEDHANFAKQISRLIAGEDDLVCEKAFNHPDDLMAEFGGRTEVVAAAYSAGPAKARRWIRGDEGADLWLWTEAIPYDVVRSYAREVAVSAAVYAAWLGEPPPDAHISLQSVR